MMDRLANAFNRWFSSPRGVVQIFFFATLWPIFDLLVPRFDPNMFHYLAVMTWFSGWTQPLLALGSAVAAGASTKALGTLMDIVRSMRLLLKNQEDTMAAVRAILERLDDRTEVMQMRDKADATDIDVIRAFVESIGPDFPAKLAAMISNHGRIGRIIDEYELRREKAAQHGDAPPEG